MERSSVMVSKVMRSEVVHLPPSLHARMVRQAIHIIAVMRSNRDCNAAVPSPRPISSDSLPPIMLERNPPITSSRASAT